MVEPTDTPPESAPDKRADQTPERVVELVVNLDDTTGELVGHAIDELMQQGALDAWATPITMKKGRPAVMLSALVNQDDREPLAEQMLTLTGSFGVRYRAWDRLTLDRDWHERSTRLGPIKLKAGALGGKTLAVKPEFDDVVRLAEMAGVSVAEAHRAAQAAADALLQALRKAETAGGPR